MVYSLDIALEVLPAGMNRAQFADQIRGHNVAAGSIVARYQRTIDGRAARASNRRKRHKILDSQGFCGGAKHLWVTRHGFTFAFP